MALVSTQKLSKYSTSNRQKLTLPQDVVGLIPMLFPPELKSEGRAELIMFLEGRNEGSLPFVVTASLQKLRKKGGNGVRVVLLESGWKPVARELGLRQGDTVSIFLLNNKAWTYSIEVERAPEANLIDELDAMDENEVMNQPQQPVRMEFHRNEPVQPNMEIIYLNQANQSMRMEFDLNKPANPYMEIMYLIQPNHPVRIEFDLNEPTDPTMEIMYLNQPTQSVKMEFDLNKPADPNMEINLDDKE